MSDVIRNKTINAPIVNDGKNLYSGEMVQISPLYPLSLDDFTKLISTHSKSYITINILLATLGFGISNLLPKFISKFMLKQQIDINYGEIITFSFLFGLTIIIYLILKLFFRTPSEKMIKKIEVYFETKQRKNRCSLDDQDMDIKNG